VQYKAFVNESFVLHKPQVARTRVGRAIGALVERVLASGTTEAKSARNLYCALHSERGTVLKGSKVRRLAEPAGDWRCGLCNPQKSADRYAAVGGYARVGRLQTFVNEKD
jgi:hypothetical protein